MYTRWGALKIGRVTPTINLEPSGTWGTSLEKDIEKQIETESSTPAHSQHAQHPVYAKSPQTAKKTVFI